MEIKFSDTDIIFIYGHFQNEIKKLEEIKNISNSPISKKSLNNDIRLYNSVLNKLRDACPSLSKLDNLQA